MEIRATIEDLVSFYKELLKSLDFEVDSQGRIFIAQGDNKRPLTINGLPVVLPTTKNIRSAVEIINGIPTTVKVIFNPIEENAIKGENNSMKKLRQIIELKINSLIYQIGESLFNLFYNSDKEINNLQILKFATLLNRHKASGMKSPIDEKTITNWIKLYKDILSNHYSSHAYGKLFVKRGGKLNNIKYNRIVSLGFPFVENLEPLKPNKEKFLNIKLRTKDKHAYISLFEFLFNSDLEALLDGYKFGSLNKIAPGFHATMMVYDFVYKSFKPIIDVLLDLDLEDRELEFLKLSPLPVDINNLGDFIDNLEPIITRIPKEMNLLESQNNIPANNAPTGNLKEPTGIAANTASSKTSNSPWEKLKSSVGENITQATGINNGPLGNFGNRRMNYNPPAPRPITPAPRPIAPTRRVVPAAPRPLANRITNGYGSPIGNPVNTGINRGGYKNPFLR